MHSALRLSIASKNVEMSFDLVLSNFSCNAKKYSKTSLGSLNVYFSLLKQLDDFFVSAFIVFEFKFKNPKIFFYSRFNVVSFIAKMEFFKKFLEHQKLIIVNSQNIYQKTFRLKVFLKLRESFRRFIEVRTFKLLRKFKIS